MNTRYLLFLMMFIVFALVQMLPAHAQEERRDTISVDLFKKMFPDAKQTGAASCFAWMVVVLSR